MSHQNIGRTAPPAKPNSKPTTSKGDFIALTSSTAPAAATAPRGYSSIQSQFRGPGGQVSSSIAPNHRRTVSATQQYPPGQQFISQSHVNIGSNEPSFGRNPNVQVDPNYQSHLNTQFHPNFQGRPNVQYQHIYYPTTNNRNIQNVGMPDPTVSNSPAAVANNTAPGIQVQRQMFGDPHSSPAVTQICQCANGSTMAQVAMAQPVQPTQPVQPAQPVAPQKTMKETIKIYKELMENDEMDIEVPIQNLGDYRMFKEAEKRARLVLTPQLAEDCPETDAEQRVRAGPLIEALMSWRTRDDTGRSKTAINRIKAKKAVTCHIAGWGLLVCKSQDLEIIHNG